VKVKPKDIDDSWNFEAKLITDFPQDEMANVGMAVQLKAAGLLSDQTIRDKTLNVDDVDLEQRIIDREKAYQFAFINERRIAAALVIDGNMEDAKAIIDEIEQRRRIDMEGREAPGVASQPGIPSPVRPSADTTAVTPQPPQASGLRKFLSRFGA